MELGALSTALQSLHPNSRNKRACSVTNARFFFGVPSVGMPFCDVGGARVQPHVFATPKCESPSFLGPGYNKDPIRLTKRVYHAEKTL